MQAKRKQEAQLLQGWLRRGAKSMFSIFTFVTLK
jgi:hypothetical protein